MSVCGTCVLPIDTQNDVFGCYGICGRKFHLSCLSSGNNAYKSKIIDYLNKIGNLHWYCDECQPFTVNGMVGSFKDCVRVLSDIKPLLAEKCEHASVSPTPPNVINVDMRDVSSHSAQTVAGDIDSSKNGKRKLSVADSFVNKQPRMNADQKNVSTIDLTDANNQSQTQNQNQSSSNVSKLESVFPAAARPIRDHKALFVSGLKKGTTSDDVIAHLREQGLDNTVNFPVSLRCELLTGKWKQPKKVTYASFKISVPSDCYNAVADPKIWPVGLVIRAFDNKPSVDRKKGSKNSRKENQAPKNRRNQDKIKKKQGEIGNAKQQKARSEPDLEWIQVPVRRQENRYQPMPMPTFNPWYRPMY